MNVPFEGQGSEKQIAAQFIVRERMGVFEGVKNDLVGLVGTVFGSVRKLNEERFLQFRVASAMTGKTFAIVG